MNNIEILEEMLTITKKNRRGKNEIKFEVNSNYYKAIENLLKERQADKDRIKELEKENEELMEIRVSTTAHGMIEELRKENEELKDRIREINNINFPIIY